MKANQERDPRTYAIIGAAMEVHRELGCGFLEAVYQEALALELQAREVPYRQEVELPMFYKGVRLRSEYRADFVCFEGIIVELKALTELTSTHEAQVINYLKATGLEVGLLINFGAESLQYQRLILSKANLRQSAKSVDKKRSPQIAQISLVLPDNLTADRPGDRTVRGSTTRDPSSHPGRRRAGTSHTPVRRRREKAGPRTGFP